MRYTNSRYWDHYPLIHLDDRGLDYKGRSALKVSSTFDTLFLFLTPLPKLHRERKPFPWCLIEYTLVDEWLYLFGLCPRFGKSRVSLTPKYKV
jgi:hypothetical protein